MGLELLPTPTVSTWESSSWPVPAFGLMPFMDFLWLLSSFWMCTGWNFLCLHPPCSFPSPILRCLPQSPEYVRVPCRGHVCFLYTFPILLPHPPFWPKNSTLRSHPCCESLCGHSTCPQSYYLWCEDKADSCTCESCFQLKIGLFP